MIRSGALHIMEAVMDGDIILGAGTPDLAGATATGIEASTAIVIMVEIMLTVPVEEVLIMEEMVLA